MGNIVVKLFRLNLKKYYPATISVYKYLSNINVYAERENTMDRFWQNVNFCLIRKGLGLQGVSFFIL